MRARGIDADLDLIGYGEDRAEFEALAATRGVAAHVRFLGPLDRDDVRTAMAECALLLAPSRTREGFGLVAAEASSAGTPCVVSDVGGLPETVTHEVSGLVVPRDDAASLERAIARILSEPALWRRLSAGAWHTSRARFGLDRCVDSYDAAYRDVLARH